MGSPLSPVIQLYNQPPSSLNLGEVYMYVDDTFVIWAHGPDRLRSFHQHLNKQHPKIQFIVKEKKDEQLPFFNVRVRSGQVILFHLGNR